MSDVPNLGTLRASIERIDRDILTLLKERMTVVEGVATAKLATAVPFRDPSREEQVLQRVRQMAASLKLDTHEVERLYRLIMEMAIARQQAYVHSLDTAPLRVAYQGTEGSDGHLAAQKRYAHRPGGVLLRGFESVRRTGAAVRGGEADCALLPIENTFAGSMNETYDLLAEGGLTLTGEVLRVAQHRLLGLAGACLEQVRVVHAHPQALAQCESFLHELGDVKLEPAPDSASAARRVREGNDPTVAAIAGENAVNVFGLVVLAQALHPGRDSFTRYVEVAVEATPVPEGTACKTSLQVVLDHRPGALGEVLMLFARHSVNLSKLESRPLPGSHWKYQFYLDVEGHAASREMAAVLEAIRPLTSSLRVLGTYPKAEEEEA